jgi:hypothetical protein
MDALQTDPGDPQQLGVAGKLWHMAGLFAESVHIIPFFD